jgi:putative hemolysin
VFLRKYAGIYIGLIDDFVNNWTPNNSILKNLMTMSEKTVSVDLKRIFEEKNPGLARYIPGFIYSYLNRALHIREINEFLSVHGSKTGLDFTEAVIKEFNITNTLKGYDNLPEKGRFIFVSNHPLGGFDGIMLMALLGRKYKDIRSLSNDILMNVVNLRPLLVPINKHGKQAYESVRLIDEVMKSDLQIMTFPSGLVSRRINGIIRDTEWHKNFISKAVQYERDIIPMHVSGRCTNFFYNLSNLRKLIGIKSNIEMFYLPDETFRHRNEHISITFGKPVSYKLFDKNKRPAAWAKSMQNYVYSLSEGNTEPYNPNY